MKNKPIIYKPKKSYQGYVSVRSYIVDKAISKGKDLVIKFEKQTLIIPNEKLKEKTQLHNIKFKSKYNEKEYQLYDFSLTPDKYQKSIVLF